MIERVARSAGIVVGTIFYGTREGLRWLGRKIMRLGLD